MKHLNLFLEGYPEAEKPVDFFNKSVVTNHQQSGQTNIFCGDLIEKSIRMMAIGMMSAYADHLIDVFDKAQSGKILNKE
jgi:hypothetical protein